MNNSSLMSSNTEEAFKFPNLFQKCLLTVSLTQGINKFYTSHLVSMSLKTHLLHKSLFSPFLCHLFVEDAKAFVLQIIPHPEFGKWLPCAANLLLCPLYFQ